MRSEHLKGLIAAPFTPMRPDGSVNTAIIPAYYKMLKENGVTGAFICGSTGEGVSMSMTEKKSVAEAWSDATAGDNDFKVMLFLGGTSIADCKELAVYAKQIGLYAISFTAPFYFKPANANMLAKACAEAGIAFDNDEAHSAAYDAERTAELFCEIVNRWKESGGWLPDFG